MSTNIWVTDRQPGGTGRSSYVSHTHDDFSVGKCCLCASSTCPR